MMLPFTSLFRSRAKNPRELVRSLVDALHRLESGDIKVTEKAQQSCTKYLAAIKTLLTPPDNPHGDPDTEVLAQLSQEAYGANLLELLCVRLGRLEFEARKDAVSLFNAMVRRQVGSRAPTVEHILGKPTSILLRLVRGYENQELALNYGLMLRECVRHESLAQAVLQSDEFYLLFAFVQQPHFDISSDAFATLKDLLTRHKMLVASFLIACYDRVVPQYMKLAQSDNYVTKRQSLKLLGDILLEKANFDVMTRFIEDPNHLKTIMILLRDPSKNIQFEAFHVFKIFVANPTKTKPVYEILLKNQKKLMDFLDTFQAGKDDDGFTEEKQFLYQQILDLNPASRKDSQVGRP